MLGKKLAVDLGTSTARLFVKGEGVVVREPTAALASEDGGAGERAPGDLAGGRRPPIEAGAIGDDAGLRAVIAHLLTRAIGRQRIFKPDMVIAVMSALPGHHRRSLLEMATRAGARTVYLLDAPLAATIGAGLPIADPDGQLVADCGAGKTDIAAVAHEGMVVSRCLRRGTLALLDAIRDHVRRAHGVDVGGPAAEELLTSLARVGAHEERRLLVRGTGGGDPGPVSVSSTEIAPSVEAHARAVASALHDVLAELPPALGRGVARRGLLLTGGGAGLEGLDTHLSSSLGIPVRVAREPELCALRGAAAALESFEALRRTVVYVR